MGLKCMYVRVSVVGCKALLETSVSSNKSPFLHTCVLTLCFRINYLSPNTISTLR